MHHFHTVLAYEVVEQTKTYVTTIPRNVVSVTWRDMTPFRCPDWFQINVLFHLLRGCTYAICVGIGLVDLIDCHTSTDRTRLLHTVLYCLVVPRCTVHGHCAFNSTLQKPPTRTKVGAHWSDT